MIIENYVVVLVATTLFLVPNIFVIVVGDLLRLLTRRIITSILIPTDAR